MAQHQIKLSENNHEVVLDKQCSEKNSLFFTLTCNVVGELWWLKWVIMYTLTSMCLLSVFNSCGETRTVLSDLQIGD